MLLTRYKGTFKQNETMQGINGIQAVRKWDYIKFSFPVA